MTKNENKPPNIPVINSSGEKIGFTYEKRAIGLVKKGRAVYLPDENAGKVIRLNDCPTCENMEDTIMDNIINTQPTEAEEKKINYLFFDPKEWMKHPDVQKTTVFDRFFITALFGEGLTEVVSLGNWGWDWSEITNGMLRLERRTEYHFVFWRRFGVGRKVNIVQKRFGKASEPFFVYFLQNPRFVTKCAIKFVFALDLSEDVW